MTVTQKGSNFYFQNKVDNNSVQTLIELIEEWTNNTFTKNLVIHINSTGGECIAGFRIYDYLVDLNKTYEVTTVAEGFVGSIAILPLLAGKKKISYPSCFFLVHPTQTSFDEKRSLEDIQASLDFSKIIEKRIFELYKDTKITLDMFSKETYFTAAEALALGVVDEIL
jgi:ATP-dependent protease ClpP protease subunit